MYLSLSVVKVHNLSFPFNIYSLPPRSILAGSDFCFLVLFNTYYDKTLYDIFMAISALQSNNKLCFDFNMF